jgi:hypothetical protein
MKLSNPKILLFVVLGCVTLEWFGLWYLVPVICAIGGFFTVRTSHAVLVCVLGAVLVRLAYLLAFTLTGPAYRAAQIVSSIMGAGESLAVLMYIISLVLIALVAGLGAWVGRSAAYIREKRS